MNALIWASIAASSLSTAIDLETRAVPLGRLTQMLSEQSGIKLKASTEIDQEILAVRLTGVPTEEALAKIAEAVDGKWVESGDTRTLVPDTNAWRAEAERRQRKWRDEVAAQLDQWKEDVAKAGAFDADQAYKEMSDVATRFESGGAGAARGVNFQRLMTGNPGGRAVTRFALGVGADALSKIGPGERAVFSTNPTRMQRPLPGDSAAIVRDFVAEQRSWASKLASSPRDNLRGFMVGDIESQTNLMNGTPSKTFLIVTRPNQGATLILSLVVADAEGQRMANGFAFLGGAFGVTEEAPASATTGDDPKIELSAEALEAAKLFASANQGGGPGMMFAGAPARGGSVEISLIGGPNGATRSKTPDAWIGKLADPVGHEPLSWHVSEAILSAAKAKDQNLIAYLPDWLATDVARGFNPNMTAGAVLNTFAANEMKVTHDGTWTIAVPEWKLEARASRVDRDSLKSVITSGRKSGSIPLSSLASYAQKSGSESELDTAIASLIDSSLGQELRQVYGENSEALRFFSLLGPAHRPMFGTGKSLALTSVGPQGSRILSGLVYNSNDGPTVVRSDDQRGQTTDVQVFTGPGAGGRRRGGPMMFQGSSDLTRERTEVLPTGLPAMVSFTVAVENEAAVKAVESATGSTRFFSARQLAGTRAFANNPNIPANVRRGANYDVYVPVSETEYTITWVLAPGITMTRQLSDRTLDPSAAPVAYEKLSADFQKKVKEHTDQMAERMAPMRIRTGGGRQGRAPGP